MAFLEEQLPFPIARQSSGGPSWNTTIVQVDSGFEQRNQPWAEDLGQWDIGSFITSVADLAILRAFFNKVRGQTIGFRVDDWQDNVLGATVLGTGDGSRANFQLVKVYDPTPGAYTKVIKKPVSGSVVVTVADLPVAEGTAYTVDYTTGVVTFLVGHLPALDAVVQGACTFHKPARFAIDHLNIQHDHLEFGTMQIPILELRLP